MPVIFLDIDGVLNRKRLLGGSTNRVVDADLLDRFQRLARDTGAQVVLASTWRHDAAGLSAAREQGVPFDDVLPDLRPQSRAEEVEQWLRSHSGVGRFAAVDNDDDGYGSIPLFQPDPNEGLTPELAEAITAYLRGESDRDVRRSVLVRAFQYVRDTLLGHRG
jgi:hypothetical protein